MTLRYRDKNIVSVEDLNVEGKNVFCRVDFNVPIKKGKVVDDTRIRAALPTIRHILRGGGRVVLASHMGRPKGKPKDEFSLLPVAEHLAELLRREVLLPDDCVGDGVRRLLETQDRDIVILLENLRFHPGEEANEEEFATRLSQGMDFYVNDAFGAAHRRHASVDALPKQFEQRAAGFLMKQELSALSPLMEDPETPFAVILGGAKVSDKVKVIMSLLRKVDRLFIGGAMVFTFLRAMGHAVGDSLVEEDRLDQARRILEDAQRRDVEIVLPRDFLLGRSLEEPGEPKVSEGWNIPPGWMGLDIGPQSSAYFKEKLLGVRTAFWNGPLGLFEKPPFDKATMAFAKALSEVEGVKIVGGGDSVAAVGASGLASQMTHVSTGGGATLEFLEGKGLPGLNALAV